MFPTLSPARPEDGSCKGDHQTTRPTESTLPRPTITNASRQKDGKEKSTGRSPIILDSVMAVEGESKRLTTPLCVRASDFETRSGVSGRKP